MTEIHYIRRDAASPLQEGSKGEAAANPLAENPSELMRRVAGASTAEIDLVILELQRLRDMLHDQSERFIRDITRYVHLNQSLMAAMKVVREGFKPAASRNGNDTA